MQFFFRNCAHILRRTQEKKFEDMFLGKIASKGTSLISFLVLELLRFKDLKNDRKMVRKVRGLG